MPRQPDETFAPAYVNGHLRCRGQSPDALHVAMWSYLTDRQSLLRLAGAPNLLTWRSDPMPHSAPTTATAPTARTRTQGPTLRSIREERIAQLRAANHEVIDLPAFMRWNLFAAQRRGDQRIQIYAQPPAAVQPLLKQLMRLGFSIDAVEYEGSMLHTTIRNEQQIPLFINLMQWLHGFIALAPAIGLPPQPWRIEVAHCLVQRVRNADAPLTTPPNPASN